MLETKNRVLSKQDSNRFMECDRIALGVKTKKPSFLRDYTWRF